jgi:hypothetical protein
MDGSNFAIERIDQKLVTIQPFISHGRLVSLHLTFEDGLQYTISAAQAADSGIAMIPVLSITKRT